MNAEVDVTTEALDDVRPDADVADVVLDVPDIAEEIGGEASAVDAGPLDLARCRVSHSDQIPLPEASGAAMLDVDGKRILLVADSGNAGRALIVDRALGQSVAVVLPLGEGGDDLEGLERAPDGRIFGLSSNGYLRAWIEEPEGFTLVLGPTPVSDDATWVCDPFGVNCGANFEGFCLHPVPSEVTGACVGWAASKAKGELVCLKPRGEGYQVDGSTVVAVTDAEKLSGCAYEPDPPHRLLVAGNLYASSAIWVVDPLSETKTELVEVGAPNQEALIMLPGGELRSYGDMQGLLGDSSPFVVFDCRASSALPR